MPLDAPVMIATLPSSSPIVFSFERRIVTPESVGAANA